MPHVFARGEQFSARWETIAAITNHVHGMDSDFGSLLDVGGVAPVTICYLSLLVGDYTVGATLGRPSRNHGANLGRPLGDCRAAIGGPWGERGVAMGAAIWGPSCQDIVAILGAT